jgi:hypothetical protein
MYIIKYITLIIFLLIFFKSNSYSDSDQNWYEEEQPSDEILSQVLIIQGPPCWNSLRFLISLINVLSCMQMVATFGDATVFEIYF